MSHFGTFVHSDNREIGTNIKELDACRVETCLWFIHDSTGQ